MSQLLTLFGFIGGIGAQELILILVIVFFLFGAKKIPELARGIGRGIKEFKDASKEGAKEEEVKKIEEKS